MNKSTLLSKSFHWLRIFKVYNICPQKTCLKVFEKVKHIKAPTGFKVMTYRFVVNALIHCATLLDNIIGKEIQYILLFISMGSIVCHNMKFYLLNAVKTTNVYTHMEKRFIF